MRPIVPTFATAHSLISAWARCQQLDVRNKALRGKRPSLMHHDFSLGAHIHLICRALAGHIGLSDLLDSHTQVPLYAHLMSPIQELAWTDRLLSESATRDPWAQRLRRLSTIEAATLRKCPRCVEEDLRRYGCAHWRLFHQWPVARHCVVHNTALHTRCATCHAPFTRSLDPLLACDPCHSCGATSGDAPPCTPPPAYWPFLTLLYEALRERNDSLSPLAAAKFLLAKSPATWQRRQAAGRQDAFLESFCEAWNASSLSEVSATLGVDWIWFNQAERSVSYKEWPPLMRAALIAHATSECSARFNYAHQAQGTNLPSPIAYGSGRIGA